MYRISISKPKKDSFDMPKGWDYLAWGLRVFTCLKGGYLSPPPPNPRNSYGSFK